MRASSMIEEVRNNTRSYEKWLTSAQAKLTGHQTEDLQLQQHLAEALREFATFQLEAGQTITHVIQREMSLRQQEEASTRAELSVIEAAIGASLQERKAAAEAVRTEKQAAHERITADPQHARAKAALQAAQQKLEGAASRRVAIADEGTRKLPAFQADKLHQYLKSRAFGTERYAPATSLVRRLDQWLAAASNYSQNSAAEEMLKEMQAVCHREHEEASQLVAERAAEMESLEGMHIAKTELTQVTARLRALDEKIVSRKARAKELRASLEAYASKTDARYGNLQRLMQQDLGGRSMEELTRLALQTPDQADDRVVSAIDKLQRGRKEVSGKIAQAEAEVVEAHSAVKRAKRIERELRDSDYDNDDKYTYRSSLDVGSLLTGYMAGKLSNGDVTSSIARYRDEVEQPSYSSSSWSSGSSSSSSSWGSSSSSTFSSSSSSGGGSYSTSDSF